MSNKRTLDTFFSKTSTSSQQSAKRARINEEPSNKPPSSHTTYPFAIPQLPPSLCDSLSEVPSLKDGKCIADQPHLDLVYFQNYIPKGAEADLFDFLRENLFFYRVQYKIKRGPVETQINTPRYTTVFGVDESSYFGHSQSLPSDKNPKINTTNGDTNNSLSLLDRKTNRLVPKDRYKCQPRPIPSCLAQLQNMTEASTGQNFNFCLVNYYANGSDSISYHSDDERFLGADPAIASFSLGAKRDFLMKHKPLKVDANTQQTGGGALPDAKSLKLTLASGDMVLMRGRTQANWLHSIPKRKGGESDKGRINITFRKAMVRGGTDNYYQYNVGAGGAFKWDKAKKDIVPWIS